MVACLMLANFVSPTPSEPEQKGCRPEEDDQIGPRLRIERPRGSTMGGWRYDSEESDRLRWSKAQVERDRWKSCGLPSLLSM